MTSLAKVGATAAGFGAIVAALPPPLPLLVGAGVALMMIMMAVAYLVVVLTAALTPDWARHVQSTAVLDRLPFTRSGLPPPAPHPPCRRPRPRRRRPPSTG